MSTMDASINVDISNFIEPGMETKINSMLEEERHSNAHVVLLKMLEEGLHCDIILIARGGSVKAHRCVLSAVSPVFQAMFQHDMKEQLSSTVDIPDMTIEALQLFLLVLYTRAALPSLLTGGIDKHLEEFLKALLKYQVFMRQLHPLLDDALKRILTADNCWGYFEISLQFTDRSISSFVREYMISNFHEVVRSGEFLSEMRRDPERVHSIMIGADQVSHEMIRKVSATSRLLSFSNLSAAARLSALEQLYAAKHGQSSNKRARQG